MAPDKSSPVPMHGRETPMRGRQVSFATTTRGIVKRGRRAGGFVFPRQPLRQALRLSETVWKENAGEPFIRITLAKVLDMSPASKKFRALIFASSRYGLTTGTHHSDKIGLSEVGRDIVSNTSTEEIGCRTSSASFAISYER